jgi:hypothetical protein
MAREMEHPTEALDQVDDASGVASSRIPERGDGGHHEPACRRSARQALYRQLADAVLDGGAEDSRAVGEAVRRPDEGCRGPLVEHIAEFSLGGMKAIAVAETK